MGCTARITGHNHLFLRLITLTMAFSLSGLLSGCGYKTMPVPPAEIVPASITDLRYELNDKGVDLYWSYPAKTVRGEDLTDVSSFDLYRAVVPADSYCDTCPIPFGEQPISIAGGAVTGDSSREATYTSTLLRPGHLYFFKVRSKSGWWAESGDSNIVSFMWDMPPKAPENLAAKASDGQITLHWDRVQNHIDGSEITELVKYQIYRSMGGGPFEPAGELHGDVRFEDIQVVNGRNYSYKVQAVTMYQKGQVAGGSSDVVKVVPIDMTPPAVPAGIEVIRTPTEVKVIWDSVADEDIKGYRIYRRLEGETNPVMIGEVEVPYTLFRDQNLPNAQDWFYSISAFDKSTPANESELSVEVSAGN